MTRLGGHRRSGFPPAPIRLLSLCVSAGLLVGLLIRPAAGMRSESRGTSLPRTVITVRAGSSVAHPFALSKSSELPAGIFLFKVTNTGPAPRGFKLCTLPVASAKRNSCTGVATKTLKPGQSATLTVTLIEPGRYEYLSTVSGQAAAGSKGLIGVGVSLAGVPGPPPTATSPTSATATTACSGRCAPTTTTAGPKPPAVETLIGDPVVGASLFPSNCGSCHALAAAHSTGSAGPNLDDLAPTQAQVVGYVENGSDAMPAYGGTLTGAQINALAAYVYSSTHGN